MSTVKLNLNNVEELVLASDQMRKGLTRHRDAFNQWRFAYANPTLRSLRKRIVIDFLKALDGDDASVLEQHFGSPVTIDKSMDYRVVTHFDFALGDAEPELNRREPKGHFAIHRDGNRLYISSWN